MFTALAAALTILGHPAEIQKDTSEFTKWTQAVYKTDMDSLPSTGYCRYCDRTTEVNDYVNTHVKYTTDWDNNHKYDYWASANETLDSGKGDCEDYAIAKYFLLRKDGYEASRLKITVVMDTLNMEMHTVLIVDDTRVLDNRKVNPKAYTPAYAINEDNWWRITQ